MSILNKLKDSMGDKLKLILQVLTPLEYIEYVCKMLLVIDHSKVELCLLFGVILNIVIMLSGIIFNIGIKSSGLISSSVFSFIIYLCFSWFRKSKAKKTVTNYEIGEIKVQPIVVEDFEIPDTLRRYIDGDELPQPTMEVSQSDLANLVNSEVTNEEKKSVSKPVNFKPSDVNDLDLSNFDYEDYFKER